MNFGGCRPLGANTLLKGPVPVKRMLGLQGWATLQDPLQEGRDE